MAKRPAFTLTELLSVLGVLFLFIAMLMPAYLKAQRHARTVTCLYNLQNLHLAFTAYQHQNSERTFLYDPSRQTFWMNALQPLLPADQDLRFCPEASDQSYGWGSAKSAWGPYDPARANDSSLSFLGNNSSSYGFNAWLYSVPHDWREGYHHWHPRKDPDRVPVFADANWVEGWPLVSDSLPADSAAGAGRGEGDDLGRFFIARHGQSVNVGFLDGHAEQIPLESLRSLAWASSRQLQSPRIRPK